MYTGENKLILICAASRGDVAKVKDIAVSIDNKSFIIIANAREVLGKGFKWNMWFWKIIDWSFDISIV